MCGGQRSACRSRVPLSTRWIFRTRTQGAQGLTADAIAVKLLLQIRKFFPELLAVNMNSPSTVVLSPQQGYLAGDGQKL